MIHPKMSHPIASKKFASKFDETTCGHKDGHSYE